MFGLTFITDKSHENCAIGTQAKHRATLNCLIFGMNSRSNVATEFVEIMQKGFPEFPSVLSVHCRFPSVHLISSWPVDASAARYLLQSITLFHAHKHCGSKATSSFMQVVIVCGEGRILISGTQNHPPRIHIVI